MHNLQWKPGKSLAGNCGEGSAVITYHSIYHAPLQAYQTRTACVDVKPINSVSIGCNIDLCRFARDMLRSRTASLGRQLLQGISVTDAAGAQRFKQTTGIVGLDVVPNSRSVLQERCQEVLKAVAVIPEHAEYRRVVEATVNKQ